MVYCTQAECLYLPIYENLPFALGGKGLNQSVLKTKPSKIDKVFAKEFVYNNREKSHHKIKSLILILTDKLWHLSFTFAVANSK